MSDNNLVDDRDDENAGLDEGGDGLHHVSSTSTIGRLGLNLNANGEVHHTGSLLDHFGRLLLNENCSDVTFVVEGQQFPAHRVVLGARSTYFWVLLYGGMRESNEREIALPETPLQAFKILLKYIYTGRCQLDQLGLELLIDVLGLAHKYGFAELEAAVGDYLKSIINTRNVCVVHSTATLYSISSLVATCLDYIDNYAEEVLATPAFLQLPAASIMQLIERNSFCAPEIAIFTTLIRWREQHPTEEAAFQEMLSGVRLALIKLDDLLNVVRPTRLVSSDQLLDAINDQSKKRSCELLYRGFLQPNTNIATLALGAKVIEGQFPTALLNINEFRARDHERTFTRHTMNANDPGIVVELGRHYIINHIRLVLLDRDQISYSYYVEVSVDQRDWLRVVDHTLYHCRGRQKLYFDERVVKFIRVVGTQPSYYSTFNLVSFEAMYETPAPAPVQPGSRGSGDEGIRDSGAIQKLHEIDPNGSTLLIPHYNVASIPNGAMVIQGISRTRSALINGDVTNYDWDYGYTCHELGTCRDNSKCIIVQLAQPYLLDSMRLLLWDRDERFYSFYVEVSVDQQTWRKVVEVQRRRSWQTLRFPRLPVVYVKIVGTMNTANEVFHAVQLECPAVSCCGGEGAEGEEVGNTTTTTVPTMAQAAQAPAVEEGVVVDLRGNEGEGSAGNMEVPKVAGEENGKDLQQQQLSTSTALQSLPNSSTSLGEGEELQLFPAASTTDHEGEKKKKKCDVSGKKEEDVENGEDDSEGNSDGDDAVVVSNDPSIGE